MIIVDTSVFIEYLRGRDPFFDQINLHLQHSQVIGLPWVFGELFQGAKNLKEIHMIDLLWRSITKVELSIAEKAWILGGRESFKGKWLHKGIGLIDAAIVQSAVILKKPVWTLDKKLQEALRFKKLLYRPYC